METADIKKHNYPNLQSISFAVKKFPPYTFALDLRLERNGSIISISPFGNFHSCVFTTKLEMN